jgi:hypothetical protein
VSVLLMGVLRGLWWLLAGAGLLLWLAGRLLWAVLRVVARAAVFVIEPLDELVTAWLGIAPVLPRLRRWWRLVVTEWRAWRSGAIEGEVMDGVWR